MNLPEALEPWAASLAVVAPDVALSLGPWLARLAPAIGPLRARALVGGGDPDGYDGLTRRGPYERLLLSEWLLADEAPDEFLRRAATRELAFHHMVYRETAKARTSVALFDAGPTEMGTPRLAHLAALLVLAQRAHDAGARFGWGVLQAPPGATGATAGLRLGVHVDNVDGLFAARQALGVGDSDLAAWADLERASGPWDDLWIVGPRATWERWRERVARRSGATGGHVEPCDVLDVGEARLTVRVRQRSTAREVELALPNPQVCVRLLRNPVRAPAPPRPARPPASAGNRVRPIRSNALFGSRGSKVFARTLGGELLVFGVPGTARGGTPRPRIVTPRPGERILAAGWGARKLVLLSLYNDGLRLYDWTGNDFPWDRGERAATHEASDALRALEREDALATLYVHRPAPGAPPTVSVRDDARTLWRLDPAGVQQTASDVSSVGGAGDTLVWRCATADRPASERAFDAPAYKGEAVERAPGQWEVVGADGARSPSVTRIASGATVVGVGPYNARPGVPLVCLDADGRTFLLAQGDERVTQFTAPERVRHATVELASSRLAYTSDEGGLGVFDLQRREELMRYVPEAAR